MLMLRGTMARTRTKPKTLTVEELRELLRGVRWRDFIPKLGNPEGNFRPFLVIQGVRFQVRYGRFLGLMGIGVIAEGHLVKFVRCVCPVRSIEPEYKLDIMGTYQPPWDSFAPGDMLGYRKQNDSTDFNVVVHDPHDKSIKPIKADSYIIGQ
jgi:hypothetical protein